MLGGQWERSIGLSGLKEQYVISLRSKDSMMGLGSQKLLLKDTMDLGGQNSEEKVLISRPRLESVVEKITSCSSLALQSIVCSLWLKCRPAYKGWRWTDSMFLILLSASDLVILCLCFATSAIWATVRKIPFCIQQILVMHTIGSITEPYS